MNLSSGGGESVSPLSGRPSSLAPRRGVWAVQQKRAHFGCPGMRSSRMWGLKLRLVWPSTTQGVGTSHLKLIWVRGFKLACWNPTSWDATSPNIQSLALRSVRLPGPAYLLPLIIQSCTSKGIWRQGIGSFVRNSHVSTLCPVVICPYLRTSEEWSPAVGPRVPRSVHDRLSV